jgi:hypothetical protein
MIPSKFYIIHIGYIIMIFGFFARDCECDVLYSIQRRYGHINKRYIKEISKIERRLIS